MNPLKIILVSFVLMLLTGCAALDNVAGKLPGIPKSTESRNSLFYGGNDGIDFEIKKPSDEHYFHSPFYVSVYLSNEGEAYAEGEICVYGLSETDFGLSSTSSGFGLDGVENFGGQKKEGEHDTLEFEEFSLSESMKFYEKVDGSGFEPNEFLVTSSVSYDYETYGIVSVCVKEDLNDKGGCSYENKNMLKGTSGAPIQINSVREDINPAEDETFTLDFDIEIQNRGKGFVAEGHDCKSLEEGTIEIDLLNIPGKEYSCSKEIKLKDNDKASAHCVVRGVEGKDYNTDMTITLVYKYREIKSKWFEVVKSE